MSSGKSTFINSILKENILPTSNLACTAKEMKIIIVNNNKNFYYYTEDERKKSLRKDGLEKMNFLNKNERFENIIIKGPSIIEKLDGCEIYDSPGINNSMDLEHRNVTVEMLKRNEFDRVIFLMNAGNLFTTDDQSFMETLKKEEYGKNRELYVVINKIDKIHLTEESTDEELIKKATEFFYNNDMPLCKVYLYSSLYFVLRKTKEKTRSQKRAFNLLNEIYGSRQINEFKKIRKKILL